MKFRIVRIDEDQDEEIIAYFHENSESDAKLERFITELTPRLLGFDEKNTYQLSVDEIYAFSTENGRIYAVLSDKTLEVKLRLYELLEMLGDAFVKINQSCLVNVSKILKFEARFSGTMLVVMKNGFKDYVSRRQMRIVKERIGIRK